MRKLCGDGTSESKSILIQQRYKKVIGVDESDAVGRELLIVEVLDVSRHQMGRSRFNRRSGNVTILGIAHQMRLMPFIPSDGRFGKTASHRFDPLTRLRGWDTQPP